MNLNGIDKITMRDSEEAQADHYRETLRMLRGCDPEAVSAQGEVDLQTITEQFETIVENEFTLIEWEIDGLCYRRYRCEGCDTVQSFPGAPGFCGECDTWQAEWTDLGESDGEEGDDDG